ncbi:MAG: hypothetical protein RDU47_04965, partial [Spirochaetia bacterium]|nr:hypothetical protein [Spirochaetia bacterium]
IEYALIPNAARGDLSVHHEIALVFALIAGDHCFAINYSTKSRLAFFKTKFVIIADMWYILK